MLLLATCSLVLALSHNDGLVVCVTPSGWVVLLSGHDLGATI